jgi:hypothetical protein
LQIPKKAEYLKDILKVNSEKFDDYQVAVRNLIKRVIGDAHDVDDFIIEFDEDLNKDDLDTFEVGYGIYMKLITLHQDDFYFFNYWILIY